MKARLKLHTVGFHLYTVQHQTRPNCAFKKSKQVIRLGSVTGREQKLRVTFSFLFRVPVLQVESVCENSPKNSQIPNLPSFLFINVSQVLF